MPRRIVLHIGFHKTGTSTVQASLRAHRSVLKPYAAIRLKPQIKPLLYGARGYSTWRDPLSLRKTARRFDAMLDALPGMPRRVLIISAEELSGHMPGRGDLMDYGAAPALAQTYAQAVRGRFPKVDLRIHCSLRAPEAWLRSAYWEHVKSSSMALDFDTFEDRYAGAADLAAVACAVADRAEVKVSTAMLEDGDPVAALLAQCDLPAGVARAVQTTGPANTRLPEPVLHALLAANRKHSDRAVRKAAKKAILAKAAQEAAHQ